MKKKFALIPVMPTPNGPLHLGHLAGPFLKMDVLARHLRRLGHDVSIVSATDPYETHILPVSRNENKEELDVCHENYENIKRCLKTLSIEFDTFINPVEKKYKDRLFEITKNIVTQVLEKKNFYYLEEILHRNIQSKEIVVGSRIAGICPHCLNKMGGYHCEACGQEVFPEEIIHPFDTDNPDQELLIDSVQTLFLKADSEYIINNMKKCKVPVSIQNIVVKYMENHDANVRLTNPGEWGIKLNDIIHTDNESVIFTYTALICLAVLCGEEIKEHLNLSNNPLSKNSECYVIGSFGFDNTVPFCLSVPTIAQLSNDFRGFDQYFTNFFYTLDGAKFSTSRRHCIWGYDALETLNTTPDILRLYLSITSPELEKTNFSNEDFFRFNKKISEFISQSEKFDTQDRIDLNDLMLNIHFVESLNLIQKSLSIDHFSLQMAGKIIYKWITDESIPENIKTMGFSILANSIMPDISNKFFLKFRYKSNDLFNINNILENKNEYTFK
ncbi:class I tRNA ligase family protein [Acinetobacter rudis]|uniref:class I tRNA ligase family protein n=1 Tax=Acinetobacter rudis TaxID=632955 RepID=UPI003340BAB5